MYFKEPQYLSVCHKGVVLRLLILVLVLSALFCGFVSTNFDLWLSRWVFVCVGVVPACLLWLLVVCALSKPMSRWPAAAQQVLLCGLGGISGAYGYAQSSMLAWSISDLPQSLWGWGAPVLSGAILAGLCGVWLSHRQDRQGPAQVQARLEALRANIRPHFLFNTLNTAMALVQVDPLRAEEVLQDLAELFRRALASPNAQTLLAEEIDVAKRYLAIEQLRFGDRLQVQWHLDEQAGAALAPILLLQPLVENAIRHGVEPATQGGWIQVTTEKIRSRIVLTVVNSLPEPNLTNQPSNTPAGHGMALRNVQERLRLLHDIESDFQAGFHQPTQAYPQTHFRVCCSWPA